MNKGLIAKASITINASIVKVWDALVNPDMIKEYMFGTISPPSPDNRTCQRIITS